MVLKLLQVNSAEPVVWEWCKNVWYSNHEGNWDIDSYVWEWCKNVWYSNIALCFRFPDQVWEWCKNVWYSNRPCGGPCCNLFENDVKMYGTQTYSQLHDRTC